MSDEEVSSFLQTVKQMKEKREVEDEARSREQEQIYQNRKERQARNAGKLNRILGALATSIAPFCCRVPAGIGRSMESPAKKEASRSANLAMAAAQPVLLLAHRRNNCTTSMVN
jgi:hypothetical protein